jgi:phosphoglycolate phosphatase-like HAD superfamily hydrolase
MIRLVLFDIDGTLIHTNAAGVVAFGEVFREEFGFPKATEGVRFAGGTDTGLARGIFRAQGHEPSPEDFTRFFNRYTTRLQELLRELGGGVFDGVDPFMDGLKALPEPPTIGLLTGNIRRGAEIKLGHFGLWDRFVLGGFGDDHEDRDEIAKVAHRRGAEHRGQPLQGDEILVIGDTPLDVRCGRAIGAKVLAVATGMYSVAELAETKPDWAVASLAGLDVAGIVG